MTYFIKAPLININEETALLVEWYKENQSYVRPGEILGMLETSKSTFELQAEKKGFFTPLVEPGNHIHVGQTIAAIAENKNQEIALPDEGKDEIQENLSKRQWTKKAEIIAKRFNINIEKLAQDQLAGETITEADIKAYISSPTESTAEIAGADYINQSQRVLILGGGNIAVLLLDILARIPHLYAVGILDDNKALIGSAIQGCPILGKLDEITRLWDEKAFDFATLAIGELPLRAEIFDKYANQGIAFDNIIDPAALVLSDVRMGKGNLIMGFCRIGPETIIGDNNFLSAYVNLEHHNKLGSHCTFGPGVLTSGGVKIGSQVGFGTGVFLEPRISIGDNVTVASGVILTTNIPSGSIVKAKSNFNITLPGAE